VCVCVRVSVAAVCLSVCEPTPSPDHPLSPSLAAHSSDQRNCPRVKETAPATPNALSPSLSGCVVLCPPNPRRHPYHSVGIAASRHDTVAEQVLQDTPDTHNPAGLCLHSQEKHQKQTKRPVSQSPSPTVPHTTPHHTTAPGWLIATAAPAYVSRCHPVTSASCPHRASPAEPRPSQYYPNLPHSLSPCRWAARTPPSRRP